jgi:hypothetical protein
MKTCAKCNRNKPNSEFYTKKNSVNNSCKACLNSNCYANQKKRAINRKLDLINQMGGKCSCGYNKNLAALVFHHVNPNTKSFELDSRRISNMSMEDLISESKKCILLCHNCHMEIHYPNLSNLL